MEIFDHTTEQGRRDEQIQDSYRILSWLIVSASIIALITIVVYCF